MAIIEFGWRVPFDTKVLSAFAHVCGLEESGSHAIEVGKREKRFNRYLKSYIVFDSIIHQSAVARGIEPASITVSPALLPRSRELNKLKQAYEWGEQQALSALLAAFAEADVHCYFNIIDAISPGSVREAESPPLGSP